MRRCFAFLDPRDRRRFLRSAILLMGGSATVVALGYAIAAPLDSMYVMMYSVVAAGVVFMLGGTVLVWHRFKAMGYAPLPATVAYGVAVFFVMNFASSRITPVSLIAIPFLVVLAAPFVLKGKTQTGTKKSSPGEAGEDRNNQP